MNEPDRSAHRLLTDSGDGLSTVFVCVCVCKCGWRKGDFLASISAMCVSQPTVAPRVSRDALIRGRGGGSGGDKGTQPLSD